MAYSTMSKELEVYNTAETQIGIWTDGKPVYRQILTGTLPNSAQVYQVGTIANLKHLVSARFIIQSRTNGFDADGAIYPTTTYTPFNIGYVDNENYGNTAKRVMYKSYVNSYFGATIVAIIEYTKTTD